MKFSFFIKKQIVADIIFLNFYFITKIFCYVYPKRSTHLCLIR